MKIVKSVLSKTCKLGLTINKMGLVLQNCCPEWASLINLAATTTCTTIFWATVSQRSIPLQPHPDFRSKQPSDCHHREPAALEEPLYFWLIWSARVRICGSGTIGIRCRCFRTWTRKLFSDSKGVQMINRRSKKDKRSFVSWTRNPHLVA